jgi:3-hydroxy-9,10-secoandrosta-1,3,5(10)-triene-9,17-dione monooxygenase reductase component
MAVDQQRFREVSGHFATGVTIVTTAQRDHVHGMTANGVMSVSLDPPLLLVCFDNTSRTLPAVRDSRRFAVNFLRQGQEDLARIFASKRVAREKFQSVTHTVAHGVPVLDDALAWLACDLVDLHPGGDHTIGIGAVTQLESPDDAAPLVWYRGSYTTVA